jgi:fucose permease
LLHLRRARIAVGVTFAVHAFAFSTWAARIPTIRDDLGLDNGDLGIALGGLAVGMFVGTRLTGRMERAARTGRPIRVVAPLLCLSIIGPGLANDLVTLTISLATFGVLGGLLDVVMNAHAVAVERLYRRPIMSSLHGLWSLGTMAGSAVAALVASADVQVQAHFAVVALVLALGSTYPLRAVLPAGIEAATTSAHQDSAAAERAPSRLPMVLLLALMGFGSFLVEGAVADWSAVFLTDERGADAAVAALGLTLFSGAMAVSRLVGDRLGARLGPVVLGRLGAGVAMSGFVLVLAVPSVRVGLIGFGLLGLGIGPVVPTVFSAAGNTSMRSRPSVLGPVVSAGYVGGVLGPVLIGRLDGVIGLTAALTIPAAFVAIILVGAPVLSAAAGISQARAERHVAG